MGGCPAPDREQDLVRRGEILHGWRARDDLRHYRERMRRLAFVNHGQGHIHDCVAELRAEKVNASVAGNSDGPVCPVEPLLVDPDNFRPAGPDLCLGLWRGKKLGVFVQLVRLGHDAVANFQIRHTGGDGAGHRGALCEIGSRPDADASGRWLEAVKAAVGCRNANAASAIVANGDGDESG